MGLFDFFARRATPERYAHLFMAEMRRRGHTGKLDYDAENFRLVWQGAGGLGYTNLGNFFQEYLSLPRAQRRQHLLERVQIAMQPALDISENLEEARGHLRPRLYCRVTFEKTKLQLEIDGGDPAKLDFPDYAVGTHLVATVAYDFPAAIATVNREHYEKWGLTFYEALEIARENLAKTDQQFAQIGDGLYASLTGDNYDASRLLLPELIEQFDVRGDKIAMVPNRDSLIVAGSDDETSLGIMLDLVEKALEAPRPMLTIPLRLDGEEWVDWLPPRDHSLYSRFKEYHSRFLYQEYAEQKEMLDALHLKRGKDLFVATWQAAKSPERNLIFSYATWSKGVSTLLPEADFIAFFNPETEKHKLVAWETMEREAGDLLLKTNFYPARYFVNTFPTDEQLDAMETAIP